MYRHTVLLLLLCLGLIVSSPYIQNAHAGQDTLILAIQPVINEEAVLNNKRYQILCELINKVTGKRCTIYTTANFYTYWYQLGNRQHYDLALDEAHFTAYRIQNLDYKLVGRFPGNISYSLITLQSEPQTGPGALVARRVATTGMPSLGAIRLMAMYPNIFQRPLIREMENFQEAILSLLKKESVAAMAPTHLINQYKELANIVSPMITTEPTPNLTLSVSSKLGEEVRNKIQTAILTAHDNELGKKVLETFQISHFEQAYPGQYAGLASQLE